MSQIVLPLQTDRPGLNIKSGGGYCLAVVIMGCPFLVVVPP